MKKGILAIAGLAGIAFLAKKVQERKAAFKAVFDEFDIKERSVFGFADKIRTMDDEDYNALKNRMKSQFGRKHCKTENC